MKSLLYALGSVLVAVLLVGAWQLIADYRLVSPIFLPGPDRAFNVLRRAVQTADFWDRLQGTIGRMAIGWALDPSSAYFLAA